MRFDPSQAVKFDMGRGRIQLGGPAARVLIPSDALLPLLDSAGPEAARDFGRRLGTELGRRAAERFGEGASPDSVVEHLGGEAALVGLGSLAFERWGRALLLVITGSPLGASGDGILAAIYEGALQRGLRRTVSIVPLMREADSARLLVASEAAADKVRGWLAAGEDWGAALAKLHGGASS